METEKIVAMAVAAVAEELGVDVKRVRVRSFREVPEKPVRKSSLEAYIEANHIIYKKYRLEGSKQ